MTFKSTVIEAAAQQEMGDFEIQPILPDNQVNLKSNYFDLQTKPEMTQTLSMRVQNFTDHEITVKSDLRNAFTQTGGGIDFKKSPTGLDKSLKTPLTSVMKLDKGSEKIVLGPQEATIITATVTMPKDKYQGIIYGDWHFVEYNDKKNDKKTSVTSNYAYSLGVILRGSNYKIHPNLVYKTTEPMLYNRHPAMGIQLRNIKAMAMTKVSMKGTIKKVGSSDERSFVTTGKTIAPNSVITLPISWVYDTLEPGTYEVTAKVHGLSFWNNYPMDFSFKKEITIKKDDTDKINRQSIKKPVNKWMITSIVVGVLFVLSLVQMLRVLFYRGA